MTHPIDRRHFLAGSAALAASLSQGRLLAESATDGELQAELESPYQLHFAQPATRWPDALPVGNGRLGAMVFGDPALERIQLNEESIWDGQPGLDRNNPRAAAAVPRIREMLFAGRITEAEALATSDMLAIPRRLPCYQTLGDLRLDFSAMGLAAGVKLDDYRLELDLDTAICTTSFSHEGVEYRREVFSSGPNQVIVVRLTAAKPNKLSVNFTLDRPGPTPFTVSASSGNSLTLEGQALPVNDNPGLPDKEPQTGVRFHARLLAVADLSGQAIGDRAGGVAGGNRNSLGVENATAITLLIDCATSYRYPSASTTPMRLVEGDLPAMRAAVSRNLIAASKMPYEQLRARHVADHQKYFRRLSFSLGPDPLAPTPTDTRVSRIKAGGEDPHLYPIYLQFGRYLLASSSRPGTLAANLQGIWNESVDPPWGSKYTVNINAEMNYWLAERGNLSDCHAPLFDLLDQTNQPGTLTAQEYYRARGSVVHHNTDIWGDAVPIDGLGGGIWAMGSAWLALHLWDHFEYTGDQAFLRQRALATLARNARFLLDYLVVAPAGTPYAGMLVSGPSCSPENKYKLPDGKSYNLCMSPTMDIAITRAVLARFLQAAALASSAADAELVARAKTALPRLPPYRVMPDGRLAEWPENFADQEPGHRHVSPLFGLYPEQQITPGTTPELARACRATLDARLAAGSGSTGWSRAWIINCMARLQDGDAAWQNLLELVRQCTRHNLFDVCGLKENSPFQIDGNLGAPAGILEMLLQSHETTPEGHRVLRLLPALPIAWPQGVLRGVRARGGVELDLIWAAGRLSSATLRSTIPITVSLLPPKGVNLRQPSQSLLGLKPGRRVTVLFT